MINDHILMGQMRQRIAELEKSNEDLVEAIKKHRDQKWGNWGFRYDDWDSRLYKEAGLHPLY